MIDVAVVGLGWWGTHIVSTLERAGAAGATNLRVVATVDPNPATRATATSLDAVLDDAAVQAVILCTPHSTHEDQIVLAAKAGKHVFCEKPLALTAAAAQRAVDVCNIAGVVLGIGHERRFEPVMDKIRRMASVGELGTLLHAEAAFSHDRFAALAADNWRGSAAEAPAAGMTGMGIHLTDAFISMFGAVAEVHAFVARRVLALPTGDVVSAHLRFRSGVTAALSAISATPYYGRFAVFGSEAWVETRDEAHPEAGAPGHLTICRRNEHPTTVDYPATDPVLANLEAFAAAVEGRSTYPFTDDELVHNVAVLEAIVQSAASGQPVPVTHGGSAT
ncbi:MAG TPA: Gfo/Idh/MocA family oxidoreductase [Acidimicrobiales bacterium]|nr:Gfo/Idh/MocA family oxidoreductase [Acidimicrobiales bacterium]